jgi:hypothetical protein
MLAKEQPPTKRPTGLTVIMALWLIDGAWMALKSASRFLIWGPGPLLYDLATGLSLLFGALYIIAALGFRGRKPWSYRLGLMLPVFGLVIVGALYAYLWVEFGFDPVDLLVFVIGAIWVAVAWGYLRRPHVRKYLCVGQTLAEASRPPSSQEPSVSGGRSRPAPYVKPPFDGVQYFAGIGGVLLIFLAVIVYEAASPFVGLVWPLLFSGVVLLGYSGWRNARAPE